MYFGEIVPVQCRACSQDGHRKEEKENIMKHRDRILMALNYEQPDRCPMQISFTPEFALRLRENLGMVGKDPHNPHGGGNPYDLEMALDEDMLLTSVGWANSYYMGEDYTDEWGIAWKAKEYTTPFGVGKYTEIVGHPLADDAVIETYCPPDPTRPELYREAAKVLQAHKDEYWSVGVTVTTIFETAWALRGLEQMIMDFAINPELAERIL
jgi:hypothetical protein